jgi:site-specific DNA-methyltransferase (adenine-specific)
MSTKIIDKDSYIKYANRIQNKGIDGCTPVILIDTMINKLDLDWSNPNLRILDPCFGFGGYLFFVYLKLKQYHSDEHILNNMIYGIEIEPFRFTLVKEKLKIKNLYNEDFLNPTKKLEKLLNMKFDVIVGNPPYQEMSKNGGVQPKSHSLWAKFVVYALTSVNVKLKNNGYVTFVTPSSWGSPSNEIFKLFKKNNLILVDTTVSQHFKENSTFSYWIVQKSNYSGLTTINGRDFNLKNIEYLQSDINELSIKIHEIFNKSNHPKLLWESDTTKNHSSKKNKIWNKTKVGDYIYEVYHTNAQTYYSNTKSKSHDYLKVFLTLSGYYNPILDNGNISTSEVVPYIIVNSKEEGENLLSILNSKLYKYIVNSAKWSGFINKDILRLLPNIGLDRKWNDIDVYNEFGIKNKEEIDYIENYVG